MNNLILKFSYTLLQHRGNSYTSSANNYNKNNNNNNNNNKSNKRFMLKYWYA